MKKIWPLALMITGNVLAWGPTGHRTVAEVAQSYLSPAAGLKAYQLLGGQSLARVANWADDIKSDPQNYSYTYNWHYTEWPNERPNYVEEGGDRGIIFSAIKENIATLKDSLASVDKKVFALKMLVHLMGDLHMPLHIGNGLDNGGTTCKILFHGQQMSLHVLWDEEMLNFTKLSFTELARFVKEGISSKELAQMRQGTIMDWARESKDLRDALYPDAERQYCRKDLTPGRGDLPKLGYEYSSKFMPLLERRLFLAGLRLAELLNHSL